MSNDAILYAEDDWESGDAGDPEVVSTYLQVENALTELVENGYTALARTNLDVYSKGEVNELVGSNKTEIDSLSESTDRSIEAINNDLDTIRRTQDEYVKKDGSTPFESIQEGVTPNDNIKAALVTVDYIVKKLASYPSELKMEQRIGEVLTQLDAYALNSEVYKKDNTYSQAQIKNLLDKYVKTDGSTPLKAPQEGQYPKLRAHLSTKGYVDDIIKAHKNETDPHGLQATINTKLTNYYKKSETYTKAQTYSRLQIDAIIDKLVAQACEDLIQTHINTTQHLSSQEVQQIVKIYSSTHLVTKDDLEDAKAETSQIIKDNSPIWKTSGPVLTTVGFVEDNTELPAEMTMQEILDSIFYGSKISISVEETMALGEQAEILLCMHGGLSTDSISLYQNEEVIEAFTDDDFADGCITVLSKPITEDTTFTFKVIYSNGLEQIETATVRVLATSFIGLLPKWKFGNTITMEYLEELAAGDKQNNKFITIAEPEVTHSYNFKDPLLQHFFIAVPSSQGELKEVATASQRFDVDAFNVIDAIPLHIASIDTDIIYTIYIYKQALSSLNQDITFKFEL